MLTADQLDVLEHEGSFAGAPVDLEALGDSVKWEESRGGALFPHIYGVPLTLDVVLDYGPLEYRADGSIKLPVTG